MNAIDLWTQHHAMILLMAKYFAGKNYYSRIQIVHKRLKEIKVYTKFKLLNLFGIIDYAMEKTLGQKDMDLVELELYLP